jgi:hypothetical protein
MKVLLYTVFKDQGMWPRCTRVERDVELAIEVHSLKAEQYSPYGDPH